MDKEWNIELLEDTFVKCGPLEIHNSDQGIPAITVLRGCEIKIFMDSKGRVIYNIYIVRFWKSIKYEKIDFNPEAFTYME